MQGAIIRGVVQEAMQGLLDHGRPELAAPLAHGLARLTAGPDPVVACEVVRLVAAREWQAAFALGCRHLASRGHQAATRAVMVRAAMAAGGDDAAMAALAALVAEGDASGIPGGLYLMACAAGGRPADLGLASALAWQAGVFVASRDCEPELIGRIIDLVRPRLGRSSLIGELAEIVDRMPARLPGDVFRDRPHATVQLAPSSSAPPGGLLVCLAGAGGKVGMPHNVFHRWAARTGAHVLYLRDPAHHDFRDGVAEIGCGFPGLVGFVRALAETLGVRHVATFGNSAGGMAAARLGLQAGARRIVVAAGIASRREARGGTPPARQELEQARCEAARALGELAGSATPPAEILWIFARDNGLDAADAETMAGVRGVTLMALPIDRHNVARHLVAGDALAPILDWAAGGRDTLDPASAHAAEMSWRSPAS